MESMYQIGSTSEAHQQLSDFVGTWKYVAQRWMSPDEPPILTTGNTISSLIFDGRYLMQQVNGGVEAEG